MFRKINFVPDNYYHIYNRGTDKRAIFLDKDDYFRFLNLLLICNQNEPIRSSRQGRSLRKPLVDIGAYCLMPNHFHLLIREKSEIGIPAFMKKLCTAYAMYFNKKNERTGNLFQGRFKAELATNDDYLRYLFSYIHLNPIKLIEAGWKEKGIKDINSAIDFLDKYQWSSYSFYTGKKKFDSILNNGEFPKYFEDFEESKNFIKKWPNYQVK